MIATEVIWHELECGAYLADLPLWEALAVRAGGEVLELGCGTGRVALYLARQGHRVTGIDLSPSLVAGFNSRAEFEGLPAHAIEADVRSFALARRFEAVIAPMQMIQLLAGHADRVQALHRVAGHLEPGGLVGLALAGPVQSGAPVPPLPDVAEREGWIYSSLPIDVRNGPARIEIRRLRQRVSPAGELDDELHDLVLAAVGADELEAEAQEAGLSPLERVEVSPTDHHLGSTVVIAGSR